MLLINSCYFNPATGEITDPQSLLIQKDGKIENDAALKGKKALKGKTIDLKGYYLLPGFVDSHVHLGGPTSLGEKFGMRQLINYFRYYPERGMLHLQHGITAIRSLGDWYPWVVKLKHKRRSSTDWPLILTSGPMFTQVGGHPASTLYKGNERLIAATVRQVDETEDIKQRVLELVTGEKSVDWIKIILQPIPAAKKRIMDPELAKEIVKEAHEHDIPISVHVGNWECLEIASTLGVETIEHIPSSPDDFPGGKAREEVFENLLKSSTAIIPTLAAINRLGKLGENHSIFVREAVNRGIKMLAGSDAPNTPMATGFHDELQLLETTGLDFPQVLRSATTDARAKLQIQNQAFQTGSHANFVLYPEKVIVQQEIDKLIHPSAVINKGKMYWLQHH